jgi:hypothetical protein
MLLEMSASYDMTLANTILYLFLFMVGIVSIGFLMLIDTNPFLTISNTIMDANKNVKNANVKIANKNANNK